MNIILKGTRTIGGILKVYQDTPPVLMLKKILKRLREKIFVSLGDYLRQRVDIDLLKWREPELIAEMANSI